MTPEVLRPTNPTIIGMLAVRQFVDWLYDDGPDGPSMPREKLLQTFWNRVANEALQDAAGLERPTHEDIERWQASGELHRVAGMPPPATMDTDAYSALKILPFRRVEDPPPPE